MLGVHPAGRIEMASDPLSVSPTPRFGVSGDFWGFGFRVYGGDLGSFSKLAEFLKTRGFCRIAISALRILIFGIFSCMSLGSS